MAVILVVNDDHDLLDVYESVLQSMGHEPVTKLTIASGPETVHDVGAQALVVDLPTPDEDAYGLRIIEELRSDPRTTNLPIVLCSGASAAIHALRFKLAAWGVAVVVKPFRIDELEAKLRAAFEAVEDDEPAG